MENTQMPLPQNFSERLQKIIPPALFGAVIASFSQIKPTTIRINTLKCSADYIEKMLNKQQIQFEKVPWLPDAYLLKDISAKKLSELHEYQIGLFYVQNLSSQIPALILGPKPGNKVLDLCAAPGSKTTQIASLMQNQGLIVANDINHVRLLKLQANLKIQGVTIANTVQYDGIDLWKMYENRFDSTLVDAPCSLEGKMLTHIPKTIVNWSVDRIHKYADLQKKLLFSAYKSTRVGGTIVYSTCTMAPEENEGVIDYLLADLKGKIELEKIDLKEIQTYPVLTEWENIKFNSETANTVRILPNEHMEAFYIAKIRKLR